MAPCVLSDAGVSVRRVALRWLPSAIGLVVCLCIIASTVRASTCKRARTVLENATPSAMIETSATRTTSLTAPTDPAEPSSGVPEHAPVDAKTCASSALVMPTLTSVEPRIAELTTTRWSVVAAMPRIASSGIERPPRRA